MKSLSGNFTTNFALIKGRGRGQNSWLSPEGCAMTSFQLQYSLSSKQGQNASLLQHLVSLAVVHSLKDLLELNLKWPNDIYYGPNIKMGGVVILSSILRVSKSTLEICNSIVCKVISN